MPTVVLDAADLRFTILCLFALVSLSASLSMVMFLCLLHPNYSALHCVNRPLQAKEMSIRP